MDSRPTAPDADRDRVTDRAPGDAHTPDHEVAENGERVPGGRDHIAASPRTAATLRDPDAPGNHVDDEAGPVPEPNEPG